MRRWWAVTVVVALVAGALGVAVGRRTTVGDSPAASAVSTDRLHVAPWVQDWPVASPLGAEDVLDVSPEGGGSACTVGAPCSLETARVRARQVVASAPGDVVVRVGDGTYRLEKPLELTGEDSGRVGHRIVWRAADGAHPVLTAGQVVTGWHPADDGSGDWVAAVPPGTASRQLWVGGTRATRARSEERPNGWSRTPTGFRAPDDRIAGWRRPTDLEVVSFAEWRAFRCPVASVVGREVTMAPGCWHNASEAGRFSMDEVTWIENAPELLDQPGEWYLDPVAGVVRYRPRPGEDLAAADVELAGGPAVFRLQGSAASPVHDVGVEGLTFRGAGWVGPSGPDGYAAAQAGWYRTADAGSDPLDLTRTPGAVSVDHVDHVRIERCSFVHLGAVGLDLGPGSQDVAVIGDRFTDLSSTAVQIGDAHQGSQNPPPADQLDRLQVADNLIEDVAVEYVDAVGIFVAYASNTSLLHNELRHLPYSAISIGWGWGTDSYARNDVVAGNRIDDVVTTLQDGGAIYTLSPMPGSVVERNHITGQRHRSGAIFLDEGTAFVTVADNVVEGCPRWLHIWTASIHDNVVVDNAVDGGDQLDAGVRNRITANHDDREAWPPSAAAVVAEAGLEPAYADLRSGR